MKILLLNPPFRYFMVSPRSIMPPLGLLYLGAALLPEHNVKILDAAIEGFMRNVNYDQDTMVCGLSLNEISRRVGEFNPHVLGISCLLSMNYPVVQDIFRRIKNDFPEITIVLGGIHPTIQAEEIMAAESAVDYIILGEGEENFKQLIALLVSGGDPSEINGLAYRDSNKVIIQEKTSYIGNLNDLSFPAWDLVNIDLYEKTCVLPQFYSSGKGKMASIVASRGCPYHCSFCVSSYFWGNRYRLRSSSSILAEMETLITKHQVRRFMFIDDNFMVNRTETINFLNDLIARRWDIEWSLVNGLSGAGLDEELIALMKRSGLSFMPLSVESFSRNILTKYVHKPTSVDNIKTIINLFNKYDIDYLLQFVLGFPSETKETLRETFDYIEKLGTPPVMFFLACPFPRTKLYEECIEKEILSEDFDITSLNLGRSFIHTRDLSPGRLTDLVHRQQAYFNLMLLVKHPLRSFRNYWKLFYEPVLRSDLLRLYRNKFLGFGFLRRFSS